MNIWKCIGATGLCFLLATPAYAAETPADEEAKEEAEDAGDVSVEARAVADAEDAADDKDKDWGLSFRLGSTIGQGTFVNVDSELSDPGCTPADQIETGCIAEPNNAFDRANLSYSLSGSYNLPYDFSASTTIALVQWLTAGGGIDANEAQEIRFQDIGLSLGHKGYTFEGPGITLSPGADFSFPTSRLSQISTLVLGTSLGLSISKTFFDKLGMALNLGGGKDFHRFTAPVLNTERLERELSEGERANLPGQLEPEAVIFRAGGSEDLGRSLVAIQGVNTEWSFVAGLSASIPVWQKLRASASYSLITFWSYSQDNEDEFTPDEEFIQTGRGVGQVMRTGVSLSYPITLGDFNLGLSGGIATGGFPKTSDNQSFRFPFWNFQGAASNASSLRFGISAAY